MKKYLLLLLSILIYSYSVNAQIKITETFDGTGTLDWNEYAYKDGSALIKMGVLDLEVRKDSLYATIGTDLPILPEYDFKISIKLIIPKFDEKEVSAIFFNMDEDFKRLAFIFQEDKFFACTYNNGKFMNEGVDFKIKLPKKKNRELFVQLERRGGRIIVSYDNVEIFRWKRTLNSPYLGFATSSHLKVDEIVIEQEYTGEE